MVLEEESNGTSVGVNPSGGRLATTLVDNYFFFSPSSSFVSDGSPIEKVSFAKIAQSRLELKNPY